MRSDQGIEEEKGFLRFEWRIKSKQTIPGFLRSGKIVELRFKIKISEVHSNVRGEEFIKYSHGIDAGMVAKRKDLIFLDDVGGNDFFKRGQAIVVVACANIKIREFPIYFR